MSERLVLGPLLSVESDNKYVVCFLSKTESIFSVQFNNTKVEAKKIATLKYGFFYRVSYAINQTNKSNFVNYKIIDIKYGRIIRDSNYRDSWKFYIPSMKEEINYTSTTFENLSKVNKIHKTNPYSLILINGAHINTNKLWTNIIELLIWSKLNNYSKIKVTTSKKIYEKLNNYYEKRYIEKWNNKEMSLALASIPSIMMWEDRDVFHGCNTCSKDLINCDIYKSIFKVARKYFEIFQLKTIKNETLLTKDRSHFSISLKFRNHHILALDKFSLSKIV